MKSLLFAVAVALPISVRAQTGIDLDQARAYFEELRQLGQSDGGRLWGREVAGPMFFVDPESRSLVANMPDPQGSLRQEKGVWVGTLPIQQSPANTSVDLNGRRWAMVMWPITDNRYGRGRLLMHESFHRIQSELGLPANDRASGHFATAEGRIWTRLEWRALTEALLRSGAARKKALTDALTFRARRRALFANAAEDEKLMELNEGLAEYTGYMLSGLPRSVLNDRIAVRLASSEDEQNFSRSFAYASGPAYALLLDAAGIPWRKRLTVQRDLGAMAAQAYGIGVIDAQSADSRTVRYAAARMIAAERARETERIATEKQLRARFVDGPTVLFPVAGKFNYSFDPNAAKPIQGVGTVFETSRITDEWGVLEVSTGGVLLKRTNGAITQAAVAAPATDTAPFKGDGWTLQLSPGWEMHPGPRKGDWIVSRK